MDSIINDPVLQINGLKKYFRAKSKMFATQKRWVHAVDGIDFQLQQAKSLALVGESGCGKTTTARLIVALEKPTQGTILYKGVVVNKADLVPTRTAKKSSEATFKDLLPIRKKIQMIFQDPYDSLNPRMTIFESVCEPLEIHHVYGSKRQGKDRAREERVSLILSEVGLTPVTNYLDRFPHELSGGQRQRVAIARGLILDPDLLIADEPTSMLDLSIRASIIKLLLQIVQNRKMTFLYITHDFAVARYMAEQIAVMYLGKIVELGETEEVLKHPAHPYTQALLTAIPQQHLSEQGKIPNIKGSVSSAVNPPEQCRFLLRCPFANETCENRPHPDFTVLHDQHKVACYFPLDNGHGIGHK